MIRAVVLLLVLGLPLLANAAAPSQFSGWRHPQTRKASGVSTKGYSVATRPSVHKHRFESWLRTASLHT